jgi:hypothetical protein
LLCSALCDRRQGKPQPQHGAQHERTLALHHRGRIRRSAGRPTHTPAHGKASGLERRMSGGFMHWVASCQAQGCNAQDATASFPTRDPRSTHCLTMRRSFHECKGRHQKVAAMLADFCIAKRRAMRHSSSHPKNPARSEHADSIRVLKSAIEISAPFSNDFTISPTETAGTM